MKLRVDVAIATLVLFGCTEPSQSTGSPDPRPAPSVVYEGLATQVLFVPVRTRGYDIYRPQSPRIFQVGIEYDEGARTVTLPGVCRFPVEATESTLTAIDERCIFPDDSGLPNQDLRSQAINEFDYDLESTRFALVTASERRLTEGEYGLLYEVLEGALGDDDQLAKYPRGRTGFEYKGARLYTFQPTAFDDDTGCTDLTQFQADDAAGVVALEESGEVMLSGWGCSSDLQGISEQPVSCEYDVQLPAPVPRLWLTQLELSEAGFLMKGELRGADYKYCVELEAQTITKL